MGGGGGLGGGGIITGGSTSSCVRTPRDAISNDKQCQNEFAHKAIIIHWSETL